MKFFEEVTHESSNSDAIHQATVLIVDDHLENVRSLSLLLSSLGHYVRKATCGEMALESISASKPDIVFLDILMPEMDGFEVCKRLKENPITSDIPIIFLSALNSADDKIRAFSVGGADYVTKPFQAEEVIARLRHQIMIQQQQKLLAAQNRKLHLEIRQRKKIEKQLQQANLELKRLANTDSLTQIANRRCFDQMLQYAWQCLWQKQEPISLTLCDIDYFKKYNDYYGHLAGDACLQKVAKIMCDCISSPNTKVARYGGEEFAILSPSMGVEEAVTTARRIQSSVDSLSIPHAGSPVANHITLSLGIACSNHTSISCPEQLIAAADTALYRAKTAGRNTWKVFSEDSSSG